MNLEQLRKQAKELVKAARSGDPEALDRLGGREPILANAQLVLARENGYASWPAVVVAAEASVEAFVDAATNRRRERADALLAARPEIERDVWAALVLGRRWDGDPNRPGGPLNWAPILYVCHSVYASRELAGELLARGADPNATFTNEYGEVSALYGAAGVIHEPELTRILLEAGASPDDGESVYHSLESQSPECLQLLLAHGAEARSTNGLAHALDYDRIEPVRMLLEAGADPNEGALLAHAVRRGRGPEFLQLLVDYGAELEALGGETWRGDVPLRRAYQHAVLRNRTDEAELLAELGASTAIDPADAVVAAVDHAAWMAKPDVARLLLAGGADPNAPSNADFETPLAWAVWASAQDNFRDRDYVAVADALVDAGASIDPRYLDAAAGPLLEWLQLRVSSEL
jgi:ankyrin repeat protein